MLLPSWLLYKLLPISAHSSVMYHKFIHSAVLIKQVCLISGFSVSVAAGRLSQCKMSALSLPHFPSYSCKLFSINIWFISNCSWFIKYITVPLFFTNLISSTHWLGWSARLLTIGDVFITSADLDLWGQKRCSDTFFMWQSYWQLLTKNRLETGSQEHRKASCRYIFEIMPNSVNWNKKANLYYILKLYCMLPVEQLPLYMLLCFYP